MTGILESLATHPDLPLAGCAFLAVSTVVHLVMIPVALFRWKMDHERAYEMIWLCTVWPVLLYRLPKLVREEEMARKARIIREVMET